MADFVARPEGQYLAAERYLYWSCAGAFGFALWGRPEQRDIESLASALTVELRAECAPHVSLVDASRLEGADPRSFEVLRAYVTRNHRALAVKVTRLALVRPEAMVGAVVAGFFQVMDAPYPTGVFTDAREAADFLGLDPSVPAQVAGCVDAARGQDPTLLGLRALLAREAGLPIARAAATMGLSTRTLQRRLEAAGTSYVAEVADARLERARTRMIESDDPLTTVAVDAGFASLAHMSAAFRRRHGQSPSEWRRAHKG